MKLILIKGLCEPAHGWFGFNSLNSVEVMVHSIQKSVENVSGEIV